MIRRYALKMEMTYQQTVHWLWSILYLGSSVREREKHVKLRLFTKFIVQLLSGVLSSSQAVLIL